MRGWLWVGLLQVHFVSVRSAGVAAYDYSCKYKYQLNGARLIQQAGFLLNTTESSRPGFWGL